ncbi:hypothetical protein [Kitasatospora sp. NPDC097643]|uniref:hypothetical protein n=1 Tax=Kitasatospora sp. NPDC097643 TaxID=3157230 RepID=UPI00331E1252
MTHRHPRPLQALLHEQFAEGHTIAPRLFEEIRQRGFPGQEQIVRVYVRRLREAFPDQDPPRRKPSARDVPSGSLATPTVCRPESAQQLKEIPARVPPPAATAEQVRTFAELMNDRRGRRLRDWSTGVQEDKVPVLRSPGGERQPRPFVIAVPVTLCGSGTGNRPEPPSTVADNRQGCDRGALATRWCAPPNE